VTHTSGSGVGSGGGTAPVTTATSGAGGIAGGEEAEHASEADYEGGDD
jgi:hypothetical protein